MQRSNIKPITLADTVAFTPATPIGLRSVDIAEFIKLKLPPRETVLTPVLKVGGLAMVYAPRGIGKTYFGLGVAYAIASGGRFLRWSAPTPKTVLYVDGEMPAAIMKERLLSIGEGSDSDVDTSRFRLITPDLQGDISADISTKEGQALISAHMTEVDVVVLDNLATLMRSGEENDGDSWLCAQAWLLDLRKQGKTVLIIHHAGKSGGQRGTSRREDVLDVVIALRRPTDGQPSDGARFEVHFEKSRGLWGDDVKPFEAKLETPDGKATWTTRDLEDVELARVIALTQDGLTVRDIHEETGLSKSKVNRLQQKARADGRLD